MTDQRRKLSSKGARIVGALSEFRDALKAGARIEDVYTVRTVALDLQPRAFGPQDVVDVRNLLGLSQALFAQLLGVGVKTVCSWEQGSEPSPMACRFMDEIALAPDHWKARLRQAMITRQEKVTSEGEKATRA